MLQVPAFVALIQGLAVLGWMAAARALRLDVEWRVLAAVALPALATIVWLFVDIVGAAWMAPAPEDRGWALLLTAVAIGCGMVSAVLALPMAMFLENRHAVRDA